MNKSPAPQPEHRPLLVLHTLLVLLLAAGWIYYCWTRFSSPLRAVLERAHGPRVFDLVARIAEAAAGDFLLGFCTLLLFAVGTGLYVRRLQIWIDARSAGDAVAYGSAHLKDQALAANARRKVQQ
jgi:hypothetical protein